MKEREIKFRYWDGEMVLSQDMTMEAFWAYFSCEPAGRLMQFTGLKDKNGKDIYEGDRLRYVFLDLVAHGVEESVEKYITVPNMNEYRLMDAIRCADQLEVIGNVHENPELLA
jgi:uncharacterized phage protein (TIGR01671 family)